MGSTIPRQVSLSCIRKLADHELVAKSISSVSLWFLPPGSYLELSLTFLKDGQQLRSIK